MSTVAAEYAAAADEALATDLPVQLGDDRLVIPDMFVVAAVANGLPPLPATYAIEREDGRCCYVLRLPPAVTR